MNTPLVINDTILKSRLFLGTAGYPSPNILARAIEASNPGLITVSLRRESTAGKGQDFWNIIRATGVPVLPNTAGCYSPAEAITPSLDHVRNTRLSYSASVVAKNKAAW